MNAGIESLRGLSGAGLGLLQCPGWSALWCWLAAASRWLLSQSAPSWVLQGSWIRLWLWKAVVVHLFLKWNFWRFLCFKIAYLCLVHVVSVFWLGVNWGSGGGIWFGVGHPGVFGGCAAGLRGGAHAGVGFQWGCVVTLLGLFHCWLHCYFGGDFY